MRSWSSLVSFAVLAVVVCLSGSTSARQQNKPAQAPSPPTGINEELRKELLRMTKEDQGAAKALIDLMHQKNITDIKQASEADTPEAKRLNDIVGANTARMKQIVDQHGWPGNSLVGADGANAAFLLVQHAIKDPAFQSRCLELMRAAFKKGDVNGQHLAYLTDRLLVGQGKKQVYGTQFRTDLGKLAPEPIEDEANVDKRRKEVGLMPMAEYEKIMRQAYKIEEKKK